MITALNVANNFIEYSKRDNISITPMKLQKLLYIFYKEYLKKTKKKVFEDNFQVWKYGPVISSVYYGFKQYGAGVITDYYLDDEDTYTVVDLKENNNFKNIIEEVWNKYKHFSGVYLSELTHLENTAWYKAERNKISILQDKDIYEEESYDKYIKQ